MAKTKSPAPGTPKRRRGRPRLSPKPMRPGSVRILHPFVRLADGPLGPKDVATIVGMIRRRSSTTPTTPIPLLLDSATHDQEIPPASPVAPELREWLEAAAESLERGDAARASYYLMHALRCREVDLLQQLAELSLIGRRKLASDKRRGRRVRWDVD